MNCLTSLSANPGKNRRNGGSVAYRTLGSSQHASTCIDLPVTPLPCISSSPNRIPPKPRNPPPRKKVTNDTDSQRRWESMNISSCGERRVDPQSDLSNGQAKESRWRAKNPCEIHNKSSRLGVEDGWTNLGPKLVPVPAGEYPPIAGKWMSTLQPKRTWTDPSQKGIYDSTKLDAVCSV